MRCLILAAGYATRLYPLTENFPKPLLKVGEKAILDRLIEDIDRNSEIHDFIVVSNHKFARIFEDWADSNDKTIHVVDDLTETNESRLGAVRDILYTLEKEKIEDDLLILAGDNVLDFSLKGFIEFAAQRDASCVMCHEEKELKRLQKTAVISIDENQMITSYEEKPAFPKGQLAVPPFYFYRKEDILRIREALEDGCNPDAPGSFAAWLSGKTKMYAYLMPGKRYDIGDLASYEETCRIFENR